MVPMQWYAVSDLHGSVDRYRALIEEVAINSPPAVLMGGDLFPRLDNVKDFFEEHLFQPIRRLKAEGIGTRFIVIMGNDDVRIHEPLFLSADEEGIIDYIPDKTISVSGIKVVGYSYIHPSPFLLKDWELYDVSKYVDPGCVSPLEGIHTVEIDKRKLKFRTIKEDLDILSGISEPEKTVYLFHSPPYNTDLDVADLEGQTIDHVPLDPHIGSVAVKRFIEKHQPPVTLHGHAHESFNLTGKFFQRIGSTLSISMSGIERGLVLIKFDPAGKDDPVRTVID